MVDTKQVKNIILSSYSTQDKNSFEDITRTSFVTNDEISMRHHNEAYTKILEAYSDTLKTNLENKNQYKRKFFYCCLYTLRPLAFGFPAILTIIIGYILLYPDNHLDIKSIVTVITAMSAAFISSFMILPKIITQYLFNLDEEKNIREIIKNIQEHDKVIREDIKEFRNKQKEPKD